MMIFKFFPKSRAFLLWKELCFASSSLFGALSEAVVELFGERELQSFVDAFLSEKIKISSVFPLIRLDGEDIFFLPRPTLPYKGEEGRGDGAYEAKKVKRIKWLSLNAFFDFIKRVKYDVSSGSFYHSYDFSTENIWGEIFYAPEVPQEKKREVFFADFERPHVSIDRLTYSSNLFFTGEIVVKEPLGFYFLCHVSHEFKDKLCSLVRFIADEGLGGGRSEGMGTFYRVEVEEKELLPAVNNPIGYVGLSRIYPLKEEVDGICYFSLVKDDGFVYMGGGRSIKKSRVMMLSEGSFYRKEVKGMLFKESSGNIVIFRNGKAFLAPVGDLS